MQIHEVVYSFLLCTSESNFHLLFITLVSVWTLKKSAIDRCYEVLLNHDIRRIEQC